MHERRCDSPPRTVASYPDPLASLTIKAGGGYPLPPTSLKASTSPLVPPSLYRLLDEKSEYATIFKSTRARHFIKRVICIPPTLRLPTTVNRDFPFTKMDRNFSLEPSQDETEKLGLMAFTSFINNWLFLEK